MNREIISLAISRAASELQAQRFTIAGTGAIESLNVAATVNIALYEINRGA